MVKLAPLAPGWLTPLDLRQKQRDMGQAQSGSGAAWGSLSGFVPHGSVCHEANLVQVTKAQEWCTQFWVSLGAAQPSPDPAWFGFLGQGLTQAGMASSGSV